MKKKLLGCLLTMGLIVGQVLTANANPSKGNEFDVSLASYDEGYRIEETDDEFPELPDELKDKKTLSPGIHIYAEGAVEKVPSKNDPDKEVYRVEIYVPNLTDDIPGLGIYYYIGEEDRWVWSEAVEVDYENKIVTFEFEYMDILAFILADEVAFSADSTVGTSPKTGADSEWVIWFGSAVLLAGLSMMLTRKNSIIK